MYRPQGFDGALTPYLNSVLFTTTFLITNFQAGVGGGGRGDNLQNTPGFDPRDTVDNVLRFPPGKWLFTFEINVPNVSPFNAFVIFYISLEGGLSGTFRQEPLTAAPGTQSQAARIVDSDQQIVIYGQKSTNADPQFPAYRVVGEQIA